MNLTKDYIPPEIGIGNVVTNYSYDFDRRPTEIDTPVASNTNIPATTDDNTEGTSFTYDGSLLTSATWSGVINGSVSFTYNSDFRVSSESVVIPAPNQGTGQAPAGIQVNYVYDKDGLLTGAGDLVINRDPNNGLITGSTLGNVSDSLTYNGFGEPTIYNSISNGLSLLSYQLSRDNIGRIIQKTETVNSITDTYAYSYDLAGRLTDVIKDGSSISHYEYDTNGNRASYNNSVIGVYDNQDRLISYGNYSYSYTANGELASKTGTNGTTQYGYDNFGNLVAVLLPDGSRIEYVIDGQNRRVGKKVNGTLVQGFLFENQWRPAAELDSSGNIVSRFVYGSKFNIPDYMVKGGTTYRIITDYLGSPRMVIDVNTGTVLQQMAYDEFGNIIQDSNPGFQPFGYAGGLYDRDTGLVRFGARDYDPVTGKWTAKDPIRFKSGDMSPPSGYGSFGKPSATPSIDTNLYSYVISDPVNFTDYPGLFKIPGTNINVQGSFGGTLGIVDISGQGTTTTISLTTPQLGGGGSFTVNTGLPCLPNAPVFSFGWKYLGGSVASDLSSFSVNIGPATGLLPINISVPIYTIDWEKFWGHFF